VIVALGAACLDLAMLTERSRRRKVLPMVGRRIGSGRRRRRRIATLASAFVARWCAASKVETAGGVFQVRDDEPAPRVGAGLHRTP
jgi:hypothetical protein